MGIGFVGDGACEVYVYEPQLEYKDHATPFVNVSREGVIRDVSGYQKDAALALATTPKWTSASRIGSGAYEFSGSIVKRIATDLIHPISSDQLTLAAWVYPTGVHSDDRGIVIQENGNYYLTLTPTQQVSVYWYLTSNAGYHTTTETLPINTWSHIASVWSGAHVNLYIDGILKKQVACATPGRTTNNAPITIGAESINRKFNGAIDDVRVYATALSATDIKALYESRASLDDKGNLMLTQFVEDVEPTVNLAPHPYYTNRIYNSPYTAASWGGDAATVHYYSDGGFNNLPYKKMIKTAGGTGGSYLDDNIGIPILDNKTYTISGYMKASRNISFNGHCLNINRISDNTYRLAGGFSVTTDWKRYSWTYDSGSGHAGLYQSRHIIYDDSDLPLEIYWCGFQVEEKPYTTPFVNGSRYPNNLPLAFPHGANTVINSGIAAFNNFSEVGPVNGLIGWWPLNGNANDVGVRALHGTASGATTAPGLGQLAYSFDGVDDYIDSNITAATLALNFSGSLITKSVGALALDVGDIAYRFMSARKGAGSTLWAVGIDKNRLLKVMAWNGTAHVYFTGMTLSADTFYHIAFTYDGAAFRVYVDGTLSITASVAIPATYHDDIFIGDLDTTTHRTWQGLIQDVRIYSRALTPEEVGILYGVTGTKSAKMKIAEDGTVYVAGSFKEV